MEKRKNDGNQKKEGEGKALPGNGDEMLMSLIVMHCSKLKEAKRQEEEREWGGGQDTVMAD